MRGAVHLPLYAGFGVMGRFHSPQPGPSLHLGLGTLGGSHSPSSSASQSSGCEASADQGNRLACHDNTPRLGISRKGV